MGKACLTCQESLPVIDTREDEEGASDRGGKSHQPRGEEHGCSKIKVLDIQVGCLQIVFVDDYLKI